jgi:hypothetical protein
MAFNNRLAQVDGLQVCTVTALIERDAHGGMRVLKVLADGIPVGRTYGGVNVDHWVATFAAKQLIITVEEVEDESD